MSATGNYNITILADVGDAVLTIGSLSVPFRLVAREAEREATPPSDPAPVVCPIHGCHPRDCPRLPPLGEPTPDAPPAPAPGEDAVEALARLLAPLRWDSLLPEEQEGSRDDARDVLAALDRGAVPGYGRTGTGDGAGEVSDDEQHVLNIIRDRDSTYRPDVLDALPHRLAARLNSRTAR